MSTITNELVELEDLNLDLDVAGIEAETTVPDIAAQAQYPR
jgi:hypothetical protein